MSKGTTLASVGAKAYAWDDGVITRHKKTTFLRELVDVTLLPADMNDETADEV